MELNQTTVSELASKLSTTPEVLTKFLTEGTPEEEVNQSLAALRAGHVFTDTQLSERLANERAAAAEEARKTAVGNTYGAMDKRILAETGVAKNDNESTVDYMARAAKEKYGTKADESEEMKQLRQAVADKDALLVAKNGELEQLKVAHATEAKTLQINSKLDTAINALNINAPAELLDAQRELVKFKLMQKYEADVVDGKVQFKDKATGQVVKDTTTASPLTEAALIAQFAPTVVSVTKSQRSGAGVKAADKSKESGLDNYADFDTLEAYKKHLAESGILLMSQKGQEQIDAYIKARDK